MNKNKISVIRGIKEVFWYMKHDKLILFFIFFISFIGAASIMTASWFVGETLNLFVFYIQNGNFTTQKLLNVVYSTLIVSSLYFIHWIINSNMLIWTCKLSYRTGSRIRYAVFSKLLSVPISYMDKNKVGELMSRTTNDVDTMIVNLVQFLAAIFMSPILIVASLITLFVLSPLLSTISILLMCLIFLLTYLFAKKSSPNFIALQNRLGDLNALNEEFLINKLPIYVFQKQTFAKNKFQKTNKEYEIQTYKAEYKIGMVWPLLDILENIAYGIIYALGFIFIILKTPHGGMELNVGTLASFVVIMRLVNGEIGNLARFGSIFEKLLACLKRIVEIINEEDDINQGTINVDNLNGDIEFKNVNFSYVQGKPIIKNFNLHVKRGQKVAIVGPTGSGKTTLINLLMRFYEIDSGEIKIDGINIKDLDKTNLRKFISIVLQETSLFSESILTNISYGHHEKIDISKIINSSKEIGSNHFINLLPKGFNTVIEDTSNISSGEAQLLALTRAHYSPSNILILDEATSNIDSKTEHDVQQGMLKLMKDKTTFIIAHRLSTIVNSDLIVVMSEGEIIEKGTHRELLKKQGFYYDLYYSNKLESEDI